MKPKSKITNLLPEPIAKVGTAADYSNYMRDYTLRAIEIAATIDNK